MIKIKFCNIHPIDTWETSPRGAGYLFGKSVTDDFMEINNLDLICRAHQVNDTVTAAAS